MLNNENQSYQSLPDYIRKFLKEPPGLLKDFHYEDVLSFLETGTEERFVAGDIIIQDEDIVRSAYLVVSGSISIWKNNIEIAELSEGSFIGETFLFSKVYRMAKVQAEDNAILLKYERYDVLNYFRKKPERLFNIFTKNIIEIQQKKINSMNMQLVTLKKRFLDENKW